MRGHGPRMASAPPRNRCRKAGASTDGRGAYCGYGGFFTLNIRPATRHGLLGGEVER